MPQKNQESLETCYMLHCGCMVPSVVLVQKMDDQKCHAHDNLNLLGAGGTHRSPPIQQELMASIHGQIEHTYV